jgi:hypothetical protein
MTVQAKLIFSAAKAPVLPQVLSVMKSRLHGSDAAGQVTEASLTSLSYTASDLHIRLTAAFINEDAILTLDLDQAEAPARPSQLAELLYHVVQACPDCVSVLWGATDVRIPRAAFLDGLRETFADRSPAAEISPARPQSRHATARPASPAASPSISRRPADAVTPRKVTLQRASEALTARPEAPMRPRKEVQLDAHVTCYEMHMAELLRRAPTEAELELARAEQRQVTRERMQGVAQNAHAIMQSAELRAASLVITVTTMLLSFGSGATL